MFDKVVESLVSWTLSFLDRKHVKIIIVLSECSKHFEHAFLNAYSLDYIEPQTLDSIFPLSLSEVHQYFGSRFDSYQRIFVIR